MKKYIKRLATFLASTVFLFAATTGAAHAQTQAQAVQTAIKQQASDCKYGNPLLYRCVNPYFLFPSCYSTGVNQPGQPQHICGGVFQRRRILVSGGTPYCWTAYDLSPWGRVINSDTYRCFKDLTA